jgi:hypothetical protein
LAPNALSKWYFNSSAAYLSAPLGLAGNTMSQHTFPDSAIVKTGFRHRSHPEKNKTDGNTQTAIRLQQISTDIFIFTTSLLL